MQAACRSSHSHPWSHPATPTPFAPVTTPANRPLDRRYQLLGQTMSMNVMIRTIGGEEWPLWRELRLRALTDSLDAFRATLEEESSQPDQWWAEIIGTTAEHPLGGLWIATVDGEAAGILFGRIDPGHTTLQVGAMWVAPEVRGHGVGSSLIKAAIDWAKSSGVSVAELWVTEGNSEAAAFYESHGFQPTDETDALRPGSDLTVRKLTTGI